MIAYQISSLEDLQKWGSPCQSCSAELFAEADCSGDSLHLRINERLVGGAMHAVKRLACFVVSAFLDEVVSRLWEERIDDQEDGCIGLN